MLNGVMSCRLLLCNAVGLCCGVMGVTWYLGFSVL